MREIIVYIKGIELLAGIRHKTALALFYGFNFKPGLSKIEENKDRWISLL